MYWAQLWTEELEKASLRSALSLEMRRQGSSLVSGEESVQRACGAVAHLRDSRAAKRSVSLEGMPKGRERGWARQLLGV